MQQRPAPLTSYASAATIAERTSPAAGVCYPKLALTSAASSTARNGCHRPHSRLQRRADAHPAQRPRADSPDARRVVDRDTVRSPAHGPAGMLVAETGQGRVFVSLRSRSALTSTSQAPKPSRPPASAVGAPHPPPQLKLAGSHVTRPPRARAPRQGSERPLRRSLGGGLLPIASRGGATELWSSTTSVHHRELLIWGRPLKQQRR
jgi:hypothetical protein